MPVRVTAPHYLVFGREADTPVTLLEGLGADRPESSSVAAEQLVQRLHVALNRAKENLKKAQDRQADWANSRRKHATFKRGDQVLLSNEYLETGRPSKKLDHLWSGPFLVTEVISRNAVRLALDKGMKIHDVINIGFLKHRQEDASSGRAVPRVIPIFDKLLCKISKLVIMLCNAPKAHCASHNSSAASGHPSLNPSRNGPSATPIPAPTGTPSHSSVNKTPSQTTRRAQEAAAACQLRLTM